MKAVRLLFYPLKSGDVDDLLNSDSLIVDFESLLVKTIYFKESTTAQEINKTFEDLQRLGVVWVDSWSIEE